MKRAPLLLLSVAATTLATADVLYLANGDRVTGTLVTLGAESVVFETEAFGEIAVAREQIAGISTDEPVTLVIAGQLVEARLQYSEESGQSYASGGIGLALELTELEAVNPPPPVPPVREPTWRGSLSGGFTVTDSDRNSQSYNLTGEARQETDDHRLDLAARYVYAEQSSTGGGPSETTQDSWRAQGQFNAFVSDKFFYYLSERLESDAVLGLDIRSIFGAGGGYRIVKTDRTEWNTEVGLTYLLEDYEDQSQTDDITGALSSRYSTRLGGGLSLLHTFSYYPNLDRIEDYFFTTDLTLRSALQDNLFVDFTYVLDYDSTPGQDRQNQSVKYILGLGYRF
jgi:putative salt-induced outer membrane protein YdiY